MDNNTPYCLVLGGGGAKGVYHIGAWRALSEMEIPVNAFVGNSIGALIAGFLAQGRYSALEQIGRDIGLDYIVDVPEELMHNGELTLKRGFFFGFRKLSKGTLSKKGLDTTPLRNLVVTHLDEKSIRESGNDLGLVTFNITELKPEEIYLEDMESGTVLDYLMASSSMPGFQHPKIKGESYIDGGVYDNIPFSMAKKRGYKKIIVIDISGMGVKRKFDIEGCQVIYIKNSINMGGILDFNKEVLKDFSELGYLDTLKAFGKLEGHSYFFISSPEKADEFKKFVNMKENQSIFSIFMQQWKGKKSKSFTVLLKTLFPEPLRFEKNWLMAFADCAAFILSLNRIEKRTYDELFAEIKTESEKIENQIKNIALSKRRIKSIIHEVVKKNRIKEPPYYYYLLVSYLVKGKTKGIMIKALFGVFSEIPAGVLFIEHFREFWIKNDPISIERHEKRRWFNHNPKK